MTELTESDLDLRYSEMLDEVYEPVKIAGFDYSCSNALKSVDPIAYRQGYLDWLDSELGETVFERLDGTYWDSEEDTA